MRWSPFPPHCRRCPGPGPVWACARRRCATARPRPFSRNNCACSWRPVWTHATASARRRCRRWPICCATGWRTIPATASSISPPTATSRTASRCWSGSRWRAPSGYNGARTMRTGANNCWRNCASAATWPPSAFSAACSARASTCRGEQLASVVVVGLGMPQVNHHTRELQQWHERATSAGFDYTFVYPGMQKVAQALGRVVRCAGDSGSALLIDPRYGRSGLPRAPAPLVGVPGLARRGFRR